MNTRDLIELSQLDALGLLDEQEREEFDSAFSAASPAMQGQLRAEQSRLVKTDWTACDAEPREGLRESVLGEMSVAMRVADLRPRVLGAIHNEILRHPVPQGRGAHLHGAGRSYPQIYPVRRVSRLWRAATLGFAAAAVAFAGTTLYLKGQFDQLGQQRQRTEEWGGLGPNLGLPDLNFNRDLRHVYFTAQSAGTKGVATLWLKPDAPARLVVWKLPDISGKGRNYRVVTLNDDGQVNQELAQFASDGTFQGIEFALKPVAGLRLAVVDASRGEAAKNGDMLFVSDRLG